MTYPLVELSSPSLTDVRYDSDGIAYVGELLNKTIGPTYTYYIRQDDDSGKDRTSTFLGNVTTQIEKVCNDLATEPILSTAPAINAIGFSQGGQFLRAYVERCNNPPVANLITFGSQHNGISEFQPCASDDWICNLWEGFLKSNTWSTLAQNTLVPAQYFRDPEALDAYLENSNFLADVNNERAGKNATYVANMKKLEKFVMYMFSEDTTVIPKESAYFYDVFPDAKKVVKLQDRALYEEDWLGLKWLDEHHRLEFKIAEGGHMQIDKELLEDVFTTYFAKSREDRQSSDDLNVMDL